ncbi:anti-sigma W factor [Bacillus coahuilensis p1.1.43]|uniref:Anti-sigma W factor n=1 Tax=Bacillus coahuilensis p1.1.43 TaxID=1150625 RepID=A0A147K5N3_9BACI|nr:zf-HC2 domain-containing protein [Bacillus coahuilensis]KUP04937.1 anti-sigma W factor [Bacillus coahuilensis p1.1.43]
MSKCPEHIIDYMHDYLDDDITKEHESALKEHLHSCSDCKEYFQDLKKAIALVQSTSHVSAPVNFTESVMARLPREKRKVGVERWFKNHPMLVAAAIFFLLMGGSFISSFSNQDQLAFTNHPELRVEGQTVIVPEGVSIDQDIFVKNGNLIIEGQVNGDVRIINGEVSDGEQYLASAGKVTGEVEVIDQAFTWLWVQMKDFFGSLVN